MSPTARRYTWIATKWFAGLVVFALATAVFFALCDDGPFVRAVAVVFLVLVMVVGPVGATWLLMPAARRLDSQAKFLRVLAGITAWYAVAALALLGFVARASVGHALIATSWRYRSLPTLIRRAPARARQDDDSGPGASTAFGGCRRAAVQSRACAGRPSHRRRCAA